MDCRALVTKLAVTGWEILRPGLFHYGSRGEEIGGRNRDALLEIATIGLRTIQLGSWNISHHLAAKCVVFCSAAYPAFGFLELPRRHFLKRQPASALQASHTSARS